MELDKSKYIKFVYYNDSYKNDNPDTSIPIRIRKFLLVSSVEHKTFLKPY